MCNEDRSFSWWLQVRYLSGFTSKDVCLADSHGSGGRAGPVAGVQGWEGGSGFSPGLWRNCLLRMSWTLTLVPVGFLHQWW